MESLTKDLRTIGLNEAQVQTYLAVLKFGEAKAPAIAKTAGIKRTSVYENLKQLVDIGLLRVIQRQGAAIYAPEPPTKILEILKNREERIKEVMPKLMGMFDSSLPEKPYVQYHEGRAGLISIYEDILTAKDKMYYYFASFKEDYDLLDKEYVTEWTERRIALGIDHKGLRDVEMRAEEANWGELFTKQGPEVLREYRYMPPSIKLPVRIYMYDQKAAIMSMRKECWGLVVHSPELYKGLLSLFEFVWSNSEAVE